MIYLAASEELQSHALWLFEKRQKNWRENILHDDKANYARLSYKYIKNDYAPAKHWVAKTEADGTKPKLPLFTADT